MKSLDISGQKAETRKGWIGFKHIFKSLRKQVLLNIILQFDYHVDKLIRDQVEERVWMLVDWAVGMRVDHTLNRINQSKYSISQYVEVLGEIL